MKLMNDIGWLSELIEEIERELASKQRLLEWLDRALDSTHVLLGCLGLGKRQ